MTTEPTNSHDEGFSSQEESNQPSAGQKLQAAREAAGLSIQEVATRLNLRRQVIVDIESDNAQASLSLTYRKGYIRSYAKLLNVPENEVLDTTYHHQDAVKPIKLDNLAQPLLEERRRDGKLKWLTILIILVVLASLGAWWWQNHSLKDIWPSSLSKSGSLNISSILPDDDSSQSSNTNGTNSADTQQAKNEQLPTAAMPSPPANAAAKAEKVAAELDKPGSDETPTTDRDPSAETALTSSVITSSNSQTSESESAAGDSNAEQVAANKPNAVQGLATPAHQLELKFSKACWIQVKDAAGNRLAVGVKQPGQVLQLNGQPPYKLILGVPDGVSIKYGGKELAFNNNSANGKAAHISVPN
ncbi:cytoskeleton protein RodZ [Celerinatantimonas diazotrophica]|uniref:Cytoskeleton protein RodZ n=1 Tax=Celerinatantimonas diazotrophica TaxID=412034 RepID=A0A4R1K3Z8_9GAMM|nr:cytoskeleton protein RodZ [Celerinatantimonas diazotrophica]TCK58835.1 cytoskeleton protein RodZ [Celerinatantimonas diazotrophica]CAG9297467.1 Cytoskeleton protein RodZ [Celerinatantimonas diazotrophica]